VPFITGLKDRRLLARLVKKNSNDLGEADDGVIPVFVFYVFFGSLIVFSENSHQK